MEAPTPQSIRPELGSVRWEMKGCIEENLPFSTMAQGPRRQVVIQSPNDQVQIHPSISLRTGAWGLILLRQGIPVSTASEEAPCRHARRSRT